MCEAEMGLMGYVVLICRKRNVLLLGLNDGIIGAVKAAAEPVHMDSGGLDPVHMDCGGL